MGKGVRVKSSPSPSPLDPLLFCFLYPPSSPSPSPPSSPTSPSPSCAAAPAPSPPSSPSPFLPCWVVVDFLLHWSVPGRRRLLLRHRRHASIPFLFFHEPSPPSLSSHVPSSPSLLRHHRQVRRPFVSAPAPPPPPPLPLCLMAHRPLPLHPSR